MRMRLCAIGALMILIGIGLHPSYAQTPPAPAPLDTDAADHAAALAKLNGKIQTYTPALPPNGLTRFNAADPGWNPNGVALLGQLKKKGLAVRMVERFLQSGGTLQVVGGETGISGNKAANTAKYSVKKKLITVGDTFVQGNGDLRENISVSTLAQIAHEFWHAYKAQVVDQGYDPDTKAEFDNLMKWLKGQNVVECDEAGPKTGAQQVNFSSVVSDDDDFADEYVAAILTQLFGRGSYLGGERTLSAQYDFFARIQGELFIGYQNSDGKNYQVAAPPPPELLLQLYRLVVTSLAPKPETQQGVGGSGPAPSKGSQKSGSRKKAKSPATVAKSEGAAGSVDAIVGNALSNHMEIVRDRVIMHSMPRAVDVRERP